MDKINLLSIKYDCHNFYQQHISIIIWFMYGFSIYSFNRAMNSLYFVYNEKWTIKDLNFHVSRISDIMWIGFEI